MTDLDLLGINIRRNPEWDRPFCIMGFGDIGLPEPVSYTHLTLPTILLV